MRKTWLIMRKIYRSHFLGFELILSFIVISFITYFIYRFWGFCLLQSYLDGIRDVLYGTLATLSGALLGFVITGLSVLLTTYSTEQMKRLKKSKHYKTIFTIFFSTSKFSGILFIVSLLSLVFDKDSEPLLMLPFLTLWALIIVAFRVLRCLWVLEKIISLQVGKH